MKVKAGDAVYDAEVDQLPDPDLFRDALWLAGVGTWSPAELDATDELLLNLIRRLKAPSKKR